MSLPLTFCLLSVLIKGLAKPLPQGSQLLVYLSCLPTGRAEKEKFSIFFCSGVDLCSYPNRRKGEREGKGRGQ
jgi:hypothetical protein